MLRLASYYRHRILLSKDKMVSWFLLEVLVLKELAISFLTDSFKPQHVGVSAL